LSGSVAVVGIGSILAGLGGKQRALKALSDFQELAMNSNVWLLAGDQLEISYSSTSVHLAISLKSVGKGKH
jgi:hypothetical protein